MCSSFRKLFHRVVAIYYRFRGSLELFLNFLFDELLVTACHNLMLKSVGLQGTVSVLTEFQRFKSFLIQKFPSLTASFLFPECHHSWEEPLMRDMSPSNGQTKDSILKLI